MENTAALSSSPVSSAVEALATVPAVAAAVVVQHDTVIASAQAVVNVRQHFEQLVAEREAWQDNAYRASNDQLYALLQKCYATYKAMSMDTAEAKELRSALTDYINLKGLKFNAGTHTIVKIVKCVFGADRRRVSAYGIVLRRALSEGVSVMDIPTYIRERGGVEEIRLAKAPNAMTTRQKAAVAIESSLQNSFSG
jgi:hypothetical protein